MIVVSGPEGIGMTDNGYEHDRGMLGEIHFGESSHIYLHLSCINSLVGTNGIYW